jgi:hypothetical protein
VQSIGPGGGQLPTQGFSAADFSELFHAGDFSRIAAANTSENTPKKRRGRTSFLMIYLLSVTVVVGAALASFFGRLPVMSIIMKRRPMIRSILNRLPKIQPIHARTELLPLSLVSLFMIYLLPNRQ